MRDAHVAWTYVPLAGRKAAKVFLAALLPLLALVVWYACASVVLTLAAVACVALPIAPALAPTSYKLTAGGVAVRHLGRTAVHPWDAFKRLVIDKELLILSPFEKPSLLDAFRGQYLRFGISGAGARDAAIGFAMSQLPKGAAAAPRS